jgi:hypothetical protein
MNHDFAKEIPLTEGGRTTVTRKGNVIFRETGPWAPSVHALLRHSDKVGFAAAPKVIGEPQRGCSAIAHFLFNPFRDCRLFVQLSPLAAKS